MYLCVKNHENELEELYLFVQIFQHCVNSKLELQTNFADTHLLCGLDTNR